MVTWTENEKPVKQKFLKLTSQVPRCPGAGGKNISLLNEYSCNLIIRIHLFGLITVFKSKEYASI